MWGHCSPGRRCEAILFVSYMVGSGTQHVRTRVRARGSRVIAKTQDTQLRPCDCGGMRELHLFERPHGGGFRFEQLAGM